MPQPGKRARKKKRQGCCDSDEAPQILRYPTYQTSDEDTPAVPPPRTSRSPAVATTLHHCGSIPPEDHRIPHTHSHSRTPADRVASTQDHVGNLHLMPVDPLLQGGLLNANICPAHIHTTGHLREGLKRPQYPVGSLHLILVDRLRLDGLVNAAANTNTPKGDTDPHTMKDHKGNPILKDPRRACHPR